MFSPRVLKGGPLGEMVQWADILAALYVLGHGLRVTVSLKELQRWVPREGGGRKGSPLSPGSSSDGDIPNSVLWLLGLPPALLSSTLMPSHFGGCTKGVYLRSAVQTGPGLHLGATVCAQGLTNTGLWS